MRSPGTGLFDAHFHLVDPRFPLTPNRGFLPEAYTLEDYRRETRDLGIVGGALVSGSFQGFDTTYLVDALERLGPGFFGVAQLPADASDAEVRRLHSHGVRAVRFNLHRGGSAGLGDLEELAFRVHALAGWHVELYADAAELAPHVDRLARLPKVALDHLGLSAAGLPTTLRLVERGVRVKATGFGRVDFDVASALKAIAAVDPQALLFGTDLPSTRAPRRFGADDVTVVREALGERGARLALRDNAASFYGAASGLRG